MFLAGNQLYELKCPRRGWGCPKKSLAIFANKQRLLSIEMKTKVVQHVESDWMRDWKSVRVRECVRVRASECESVRVTFEHRDENKSCSACQEWFNERLKECESEKEWESESENECKSGCMVTKITYIGTWTFLKYRNNTWFLRKI